MTTTRVREQTFMSLLLIELNKLPRVRAWRRNAGRGRLANGGYVKVGTAGMADIWVLAWPGIHVEVECKVDRPGRPGKLTDAQTRWRDLATEELGACHVVATQLAYQPAQHAAEFWCGYIDELVFERRRQLGENLHP